MKVLHILVALVTGATLLGLSACSPQTLQQAPTFTLASAVTGEISLADFRGQTVVLVFYRGFF